MSADRLTKVLATQYKKAKEDPHPYLLTFVNDEDLKNWYFLIGGLDTPFLGGEYIFKLTAPDDFPHAPPKFEFLTPTGVFLPGGPICISVGEYHADDAPGKDGAKGWRPSLGMIGFAAQVVNGMICFDTLDSGIRIQILPTPMKSAIAKASRERNMNEYRELYDKFEQIIEQNPDIEPVRNILNGRHMCGDVTREESRLQPFARNLIEVSLSSEGSEHTSSEYDQVTPTVIAQEDLSNRSSPVYRLDIDLDLDDNQIRAAIEEQLKQDIDEDADDNNVEVVQEPAQTGEPAQTEESEVEPVEPEVEPAQSGEPTQFEDELAEQARPEDEPVQSEDESAEHDELDDYIDLI